MCKGHLELCKCFHSDSTGGSLPSFRSFLPVFQLPGQERKTTLNCFLPQLHWMCCFCYLTPCSEDDVLYPERFLFVCIYCIFCWYCTSGVYKRTALGFIPQIWVSAVLRGHLPTVSPRGLCLSATFPSFPANLPCALVSSNIHFCFLCIEGTFTLEDAVHPRSLCLSCS